MKVTDTVSDKQLPGEILHLKLQEVFLGTFNIYFIAVKRTKHSSFLLTKTS